MAAQRINAGHAVEQKILRGHTDDHPMSPQVLREHTQSLRPSSEGRMILSPAATIMLRESHLIQCGVNGRYAGIIDLRSTTLSGESHLRMASAHVVEILRDALRTPTTVKAFISLFTDIGLSEVSSRVLLDDLLSHRVLLPAPTHPPHLRILAPENISHSIARLLSLCVFPPEILTPLPSSTLVDFITGVAPSAPTIVAQEFYWNDAVRDVLVPSARTHGTSIIPVHMRDGRGIIGPLMLGGVGPCSLCVMLEENASDHRWWSLEQQSLHSTTHEVAAQTSTLAWTVAYALRLCGIVMAPPGDHPLQLVPGLTTTISPHSAEPLSTTYAHPHAWCPLCGGKH